MANSRRHHDAGDPPPRGYDDEPRPSGGLFVFGSLLAVSVLIFLCVFLILGMHVVRSDRKLTDDMERLASLVQRQQRVMVAVSNRMEAVSRLAAEASGVTAGKESADVRKAREGDAMSAALEKVMAELRALDAENTRKIEVIDRRLTLAFEAASQDLARVQMQVDGLRPTSSADVTRKPEVPVIPMSRPLVDAPRIKPGGTAALMPGLSLSSTTRIPPESFWTNMVPAMTNAFAVVLPEPVKPDPNERRVVQILNLLGGARYEGTIQDGQPDGWGVLYSPQGDRYEGQFKAGQREGWGVLALVSEDRYEGEFHQNVRSGRGRMIFKKGDVYSGEFAADQFNGVGILNYSNGNIYQGYFQNGKRHGKGILTFANGDVYKGDFVTDSRTGVGVYFFSDGSRYIGEFKDGQRNGTGRLQYASGEQYLGQFRNGRRHGSGSLFLADGRYVTGLWENDMLAGQE